MKNKHKIITITLASTICLIVIYLNLLSHDKTQKIYLQQTEKMVVDLKKDFLKDTVNNVFLEIDRLRETKNSSYKKNTESRLKRFEEEIDLTDEEFIKIFSDRFDEDPNPKMWTAFLWNNKTKEILYGTPGLFIENIGTTKKNLKSLLSSHVIVNKGDIEGIFGVSKFYIDELVKEEIEDTIRNKEFSSDSYIWVNEVINYEGGKNYAIRRVHPNLKNTEGKYLSTDIEDVKGNFPYLEELEGINKDGELFFNYYFEKLNSSDTSEKLTYAKLYKDYNWIIAMGLNLDDIDAYTKKTNNEIDSLSTESVIKLLRYIFIVLLIGFILLYFIDKNHLLTSTNSLEKEVNLDTLTKASSRRYGKISLNNHFKDHILKSEEVAIMMLDVDNFKYINDKYGHEVGDIVLIEIVKTINSLIRSSDELIRWGGDEFVGILPGLRKENIMEFSEKILLGISSLEISIEDTIIHITISIGFSYFKNTDTDYNNVLKRADKAMYKSKEEGENRGNILL